MPPRIAPPRALLLIGAALLGVTVGRPAEAEPSLADKAAAQSLFEDALQLMGAKRYAEACPKLEESERLDPALGTRFRLAECDESIGHTASAWAGYLEVADLARAAHQGDRESVARARAAALEPKLPRMKLLVAQPDTPGLEVSNGTKVMGRGQWGSPVPIDPGVYTVTATAPGKTAWRGSVTVSPDGTTVTLTVPVLADVPAPKAATAPVAGPPAAEGTGGVRAGWVAGIALIGAGGAAVVTSGVLGLVAKSNYDGAGANCGATTCNASGKATIDSARDLANAATAVFVVGVVAAAAGTVLVWTAPRAHGEPVSAALRLAPGALFVEGRF